MSKHARPSLIGAFVCGAIACGIVALMMFGGGKFFNHQEQFLIYFSDDPSNLAIGSPVKYKGVTIGQVTKIVLRYDQPPDNNDIPVFIEIDTTRLHNELGDKTDLSDPAIFAEHVKDGLRAHLELASFLTNQLYIELNDDQQNLVLSPNPKPIQISGKYKEIPSVPSHLSEVVQSLTTAVNNISQIDFKEITNKVDQLLDQLNQGVKDLQFKDIHDSLMAAIGNLNSILSDPKLKEAIAKAGVTLDSINQLSKDIDQQVQPLSNEVQATTQHLRATLDQVDLTLGALRDVIAPDSPLHVELDHTLGEIRTAMRSLNDLENYLQANPNAILTGKGVPVPFDASTPTSNGSTK